MKNVFLLVFIFLFPLSYCNAQFTIKGVVSDTMNFRQLPYASVTAIRFADSVIETFGRSGTDGQFQLNVPKEGKYRIRVTFPGFADYVDVLNVKGALTDLGQVPLITREHLLKEFVLTKQIAAIKIKGDTTEYVADSFKTKANANVEDLLKKLPGIQVDKDGKITAQGEEVTKILVDGEEFFSDDPKVVTKGLQAVAVNKVQVFDKKSEQAEFTGVDDGQKTKTINVELKENMKKGVFGKIDAGGGTDGFFQNQGMLNAFKGKRQVSAFLINSNTDKAGLGWEDQDKFGGGGNNYISDDDNNYYYSGSDDDISGWNGKYNGQGFPKTNTGGIHFADKWNEDKKHVTFNYRFASQGVDINGGTIMQYVLPDNKGTRQAQNKVQTSMGYRHGIDGLFDWKLDTMTSVKLSFDAGIKSMETNSQFLSGTTTSEGNFVNSNSRTINSKSDARSLNSLLLIRRKFEKKGRTISLDVKENFNEVQSKGGLKSMTAFKDSALATTPPDTTSTDQKKESNTGKMAFSAKLIYTEPLSKLSNLDFNYTFTNNNSNTRNYSYDYMNGGFSDSPNDTFSSNYEFNVQTHKVGANFKFDNKKVIFSFGTDLSKTQYQQTDVLHSNKKTTRDFFNIFPSANFRYKFGKQTSVNIFYQGSTQQPSLDQIQPLRQNTDPLNKTIGNPALQQSFTNRLNMTFNDYKALSGRHTYFTASFSAISDAISTSQTINPLGNTTQYVNVDGNYNASAYISSGIKVRKTNLYLGAHANTNIYHTNNFVNDTANLSNNNSYNGGFYINYDKDEKYSFSWDPSFSYNDNKATISKYANSYWSLSNEFSVSYFITKKIEIASSIDYTKRQRTAVFDKNNDVALWNAHISKKFLKNNELEVKLSVFDILNQNLGYSRTAQNGVITENSYSTIRRYGMLNIIWNFNSSPATKTAE